VDALVVFGKVVLQIPVEAVDAIGAQIPYELIFDGSKEPLMRMSA
jgi:hypothetical protein